jgi:hypothetical protein
MGHMLSDEVVQARNADCLCEVGLKEGNRCESNAGYWSYKEQMYLCRTHAKERMPKEPQA